jgi:carboxyl-terminal processing protease
MWTLRNREFFFDQNENLKEPFADINDELYAPYVAKAWQLGAVNSADNFYPSRNVTRFEALKILLNVEGIAVPRAGISIPRFHDVPNISVYKGVVAKALELNIVEPLSETEFGINKTMTRKEVADLLYNFRLLAHADEMMFHQQAMDYMNSDSGKENQFLFDQVWNLIHDDYLYADELSDAELMNGAISGMVDSLEDPHTVYFIPEETDNFLSPLDGNLEGIGAQISKDEVTGEITIIAPLKNTPAEEAGLKPGDIVVAADDTELSEMSLEEAISLIKGPAGTSVELTIRRNGAEFKLSVTRAKITIASVYPTTQDDYLILGVSHFGLTTPREFQEAFDQYYTANTKGVIVDLRTNPGGYLEAAIQLLGFFFESGTTAVVIEDSISSDKVEVNGTGEYSDLPIVVIINEYSASASEIFAGAIQDHDRGLIIGQKSYGKGTVQSLVQFFDGSALKITVSQWKTPNGNVVEGRGITPDLVKDPESETIIDEAITAIRRGMADPN